MIQLTLKVLITAALVVAVSEVGKRSLLFAGLLASLPLTSLLALAWLQAETGDRDRVAALSTSIVWLILPSLVFLIVLPVLLRTSIPSWLAFGGAIIVTGGCYWLYLQILPVLGIRL